MQSTAAGQLTRATLPASPGRPFSTTLRQRADVPGGAAGAVLNDYWWGTGVAGPLPPTEIPLCWLSNPVRLRLNKPSNVANVAQVGGSSGYDINRDSVRAYGANPFAASLDTAVGYDPTNLARHTVAYGGDPRMSAPTLVLDLMYRTDSERRRILRVRSGDRIQLTEVPDEFPEGADSLVVAGVRHTIGVATRRVVWTTTPVVGVVAGVPGPWFYVDASRPNTSDVVPF